MENPDDRDAGPESGGAPRPRYWLHALLFIATAVTTTANGARYAGNGAESFLSGLSYSVPLLLILLCHEFGHFIAARLHGVAASLPFFIPLPPGVGVFGTMGAVIRMPSAESRRKMLDIGAAGPLAGLLVAIPVTLYGLSLSQVGPPVAGAMQEGNSLLYAMMKFLVTGQWLPSATLDVNLHPTAFAGWVGLFITMLNLLPFGQLDGGHIAVAYFGNRYTRGVVRFHRLLLVLGVAVFAWTYPLARRAFEGVAELTSGDRVELALAISLQAGLPWIVWFGMLKLMRRLSGGIEHPPVDEVPLPRGRRILFGLVTVVFLLIFMPVPLRMSLPPADATPGAPQAQQTQVTEP